MQLPNCFICGTIICVCIFHFYYSHLSIGLGASVQCHGCYEANVYFCADCDVRIHGTEKTHSRSKLSVHNNQKTPVPVDFRQWHARYCTVCMACFNEDNSIRLMKHQVKVDVLTLHAGIVTTFIFATKCNECNSVVGKNAAEFNCVPGSSNIWVESKLLEVIFAFKRGSRFRLSQQAIKAAVSILAEHHGCNSLSRSQQDALFRAVR